MCTRNELLSEEEVREIVSSDLGRECCDAVEYSVQPAGEKPMGFLGEHYRLKVKLARRDRDRERIYFVKKMPDGESSQTKYILQLRCFHKEIGLYKRVFEEFERASSIGRRWHPKYYFSRGEDCIVLQDLLQNGYYMYPERRLMDEMHVLRSLEALAAMHSSSIILEEKLKQESADGQNRTVGEMFAEYLFDAENMAENGHPGQKAAIAAQLKIVEFLPGYTSEQKEIIKRDLPGQMRRLMHLIKPSRKFKNVIIHGDLWANNLLFLKDGDERVVDAQIVDFQLARYAPPAQDIVTFLHLVQSKTFREKNHMQLLRHYHASLSKNLADNGLNVDGFLTWYELLGTCDYYEELGVLTALLFFQLVLTPSDVFRKYFTSSRMFLDGEERSKMVTECFLTDSVYSERVTEMMTILINDYIL